MREDQKRKHKDRRDVLDPAGGNNINLQMMCQMNQKDATKRNINKSNQKFETGAEDRCCEMQRDLVGSSNAR